jgi:hypothetical protein
MKIEVKPNCPLNGFQPCRQFECAWFTQLRGTNPNTGKEVDEWGCAMAWLPVLLVDNSQKQGQTGSAVESLRNTLVRIATDDPSPPPIPFNASPFLTRG